MNLENVIVLELVILIMGTVYAWYNWYLVLVGKCKTCSLDLHKNPFKSKCFMGAVFFTLALIVNVIAYNMI